MRIFVSYAREDRELVGSIGTDLQTLGHEVWFDQRLRGGQDWWEEILNQLRACDLYVFGVSPQAVDSSPCAAELTYASALRRPILPIQLRPTPTSYLPPAVAEAQIIDATGDGKTFALALAAAVAGTSPGTPLPDPLPAPPTLPRSVLHDLKNQVDSLDPMTRAAQLALVDALEIQLRKPDQTDDVIDLLRRARGRPDIIGDVRDRIDTVLGSTPATAGVRAGATSGGGTGTGSASPAGPAPAPSAAPPPQPVAAPAAAAAVASSGKQPWSTGALWAIGLLSFFTAGVGGVIAGLVGLTSPATKKQGKTIIILSVIWFVVLVLYTAATAEQEPTTTF